MKFSISFIYIMVFIVIFALFVIILLKQRKKILVIADENKHLEKSRDSALEYIDALWANQQSMILDEKISSLSSLVAGVAHELNTPLGVALTALTYIDDVIVNKDAKPMVELTKINLQKSIELVEKFTEISGGDVNTDIKPVEFKEFLDYTCCLVKSPMSNKHIRKMNIDIHDDLWINTSESTLSIILRNILENAFDYAYVDDKAGEVSITSIVDNANLTLIIKDNGCGMSEKEIAHIFEPFYTTRRPERHYGLGLAIAYNLLARQHNGNLSCKSYPGSGTEIIITIPDVICKTPVEIKSTTK